MKYLSQILIIVLLFSVFSCKNNPSSSSGDDDNNTPDLSCNAIVEVLQERWGGGGAFYVRFRFKIQNIGEKNIASAEARYKFSFPDFTSNTGTIEVRGLSLPSGETYTYRRTVYGVDEFNVHNPDTVIEISDISYVCGS